MATYTDNYSLTKPTFAEVADIRTINGNMDTIDDIMHASQVSLADAYDQTATYNTGDVVMYEFLMYKCKEDNVTGNWDATKWERTTAAETGGGEVDFDLFGEASGNPVSFVDGSESALVECEVEFEPKQDLHGYSKPWAGGAGKNLLPMTLANIKSINTSGIWSGNVYTHNQIAFKVETDANDNIIGFTANGTASGQAIISLGTFTLEAGNYKTCANDATNNFYGTLRNGTTTAFIANIYNTDASLTVSDNTFLYLVTLVVPNGANINNITIKPMIRIATVESSTFEPYSNICPISGHSSVTINVSPTSDPSQGVDTTIQLGDTYYGGTLNVGKRELVIDRELIILDGSEDEGWVKSGLTACDIFRYGNTNYRFNNSKVILNEFKFVNSLNYNTVNSAWYDTANGVLGAELRIGFSTYGTTDLTAFKTWLGNNPIQVTGFLATPITVQIPPTVINTLLSQNYISSEDTEDINVVYTKSTAPIKPNPSGEADGYLSSIELSGEKFEIIKELPTFPTSDGDYKLKLSVSSGVQTLSWESDT